MLTCQIKNVLPKLFSNFLILAESWGNFNTDKSTLKLCHLEIFLINQILGQSVHPQYTASKPKENLERGYKNIKKTLPL